MAQTGFGLITYPSTQVNSTLSAMANSLFTIEKVQRKFHTPISYRSQRRLFSCPVPSSASTPAPVPRTPAQQRLAAAQSLADLQTAQHASASASDASVSNIDDPTSPANPDDSNLNDLDVSISDSSSATTPPDPSLQHPSPQISQECVLPWEYNGNKHTKLYNHAPPKLVYPAGSRDKATNQRFITRMNMYLNSNFLVRSILNGDNPHPFSTYARLTNYWRELGFPDKVFDTTTTFALLDEIKARGHDGFHAELVELLWFGGIVSYGNVMAETYAIIYNWIKPVDLPDVEGLCECNDGITFHKVITNSLRLVRVQHTQQIVSSLYTELDNNNLVMRPGGMTGYFGRLKKLVFELNKQGEKVTDAYLIRRTTMAMESKHTELSKVISDLRRKAGTSGIPTTFKSLQDVLLDTFQYEIPASDKLEKPPEINANYAGNDPNKKRGAGGDNDGSRKRGRWRRPVFPKGSCKWCPEDTDHTTDRCWRKAREKKGLPKGFEWCSVHKKGVHYEHLCRRHAPNYPPVPQSCPVVPGAAATSPSSLTPQQLKDQLLTMLAKTTSKGITITRPVDTQNFQQARDTPTNVATSGPPVDQIAASIIEMTPEMRQQLQQKLADEGL